MSKVVCAPDDDRTPLKKPLYGTSVSQLCDEYLARKGTLEERFVQLSDGRKICYVVQGDPSGEPVYCFHGGMEGKWKFVMKEDIPGVCLYAFDRPHYGKSSPIPYEYDFRDAVEDVKQVAQSFGHDQFICCGHSVGTSWSQQLAAALPEMVRGCILFASMADPLHPEATDKVRAAVNYPGGILHPKTGCCGCVVRSALSHMVGKINMVADYGLGLEKNKGGEEGFAKFAADAFWVSSMIDSWRSCQDPKSILGDTLRTLSGKWHYETKDIRCPVFIFAGSGDQDCKVPGSTDFLQKLIPHAKIEIIQKYGHICLNGPNQETAERIRACVEQMPRL